MKLVKIFFEQCKLSFMSAAIYRLNFVLMLIQSIINTLMNVVCVSFIYASVSNIAGWNKQEMIILLCTSLIINQFFRAFINPNQMRFIISVSNGSFDQMLLKPISIVFQIYTGSVDISCLISSLAPAIITTIQLNSLGIKLGIITLISYLVMCFLGLMILSSFMLILYSLSFAKIKVNGLNNIYYILMNISEKPKEIFSLKVATFSFIYLIPAIPIANFPARMLLGKGGEMDSILLISSSVIFFILSVLAIKIGLKRYTSTGS